MCFFSNSLPPYFCPTSLASSSLILLDAPLQLQSNNAGEHFPLWGTCLGFQELNILAAQGVNVLSEFDSENYTIPLNFSAGYRASRLFSAASQQVIDILASKPVTMNNHHQGVSPATFNGTPLA